MSFLLTLLLLAAPAEPEFTVRTARGQDLMGPLRKLTTDFSLRLGGDRPVLVAGEDVVALRRRDVVAPACPLQHALFLGSGDCLPLDAKGLLALHNEQLLCVPADPVRPERGADVAVPFAQLAVLWVAPPSTIEDPERFRNQLLREQRRHDVVLLRNGDRVEGTLTSLDGRKGVTVKTTGGVVEVPWAQLAVVAFNTEFQSKRVPKKAYSHVVLHNGARLSLLTVELNQAEQRLAGKTLGGLSVNFPLADLVALDVRQHRFDYVSDLKPKAYEHTPFLDLSWPLVADAAVTGRCMRLGGHVFDKGLGMHAASRVTYALDGKYQWLEVLVGLDGQTGKRGKVKLEVLVDGKSQVLGTSAELTGADRPLALRIDVRKARVLTLAAGLAGRGDVQAHVNWADARLVK